MRIIHCGDIHLDSKLESNLPTNKSRDRKNEIIMSFCRMIDYASQNGVTAVIIAGDLFDTNRIIDTTRDKILGKIRQNPSIEFLYLPGNHDAGKSLLQGELPDNFKFFGNTWTSFSFDNVCVTGVELTDENCRHIYGSLRLEPDRFNIVTMHGQLTSSSGEDMVNRNELADKGIDYLALGHYHKYQQGTLGQNGIWCYCGCLEGRGFDECDDKGFVVLDIAEDNTITTQFVKNSSRDILEIKCDISGLSDAADILKKIDASVNGVSENAMVKVVLVGNTPADARKDIDYFLKHLNEKFWFAKLYDKTRIELHPEDYVNDISLKGEFIRCVMASDMSEELRNSVIECGLAALGGREVL